jgi:UDP:flavonoid glycosyltransferase YjiC (YdhE family)
VLSDPSYRSAAQDIAAQLRSLDGPELAADVIESVLPNTDSKQTLQADQASTNSGIG